MSASVHLGSVDPLGGYVWGADPATLLLTPTFWSKARRGGYVAAEIDVDGSQAHLWDVLGWLRRPVEITGDNGQELWAGYVNEVEIATGSGAVCTLSLDGVANRVAVAYAAEAAGGGYERGTTPWAEDAASIRRYGVKEYLHVQGQSEEEDALSVRDRLLRALAAPKADRNLQGGGEVRARLLCLGWAQTLKWRRWTHTGSRIEFGGTGGADHQAVGWGLTDTDIGFTRNLAAVHDLDGRLGALKAGNRITVGGSAQGNNGVYGVTAVTGDGVQTYTASTISFEPDNDIKDAAGGLGYLRKGALMLLMYSANNSRVHRVGASGDEAIEVNTTFGGPITAEAAGPAIYIRQGDEAALFPRPAANETPGASVTITLHGHRVAQQVVLSGATNVGRVGVQVGRVGLPADSIRLALYTDSSGSPGAQVASQTLAGSLLQEEPVWVWFKWPGAGGLLGAGAYWLLLERTGALSPTDYYQVGMTSAAAGVCKVHTGSAWANNPTGATIPCRLWAVEETTAIIRRIAETVGELVAAVKVDDASGVWVNPQQDGDLSAYDVIDKLIDQGGADGARLFWEVTGDRTLRVYREPVYDHRPLIRGASRTLRHAGGAVLPRGELPVGRHLALEDVPQSLGLWPVTIDGAEYDARGDRTELYTEQEGHVLT